jgi:hypothetical protein
MDEQRLGRRLLTVIGGGDVACKLPAFATVMLCQFTLRTYGSHRPFITVEQTYLVLVQVGCEFTYEAEAGCPSLWQVRPRAEELHRMVHETWDPPSPVQTYLDAYGNECDRLTIPAG